MPDLGTSRRGTPHRPVGGAAAPTAHVVDDSLEMEALGAVSTHPTGGLDDDAFFASLREAVRDEAPLGAAHDDDDTRYFDEDTTDEHDRGLFKRRR